MARRKKPEVRPLPPNWVVSDHLVWNSRHIEPGTELSISGAKGRAKFVRYVQVVGSDGEVEREWIDVTLREQFRSFRPERIKTVHRLTKLRPAATVGAKRRRSV